MSLQVTNLVEPATWVGLDNVRALVQGQSHRPRLPCPRLVLTDQGDDRA